MYDQIDDQGRSLLIKQQNADFRNDYFNDRVESARVEGTCRWLLYQDVNFLGQESLINAYSYDSPLSWGGSGNRVSSARALPPAGTVAIVLFQHTNFRGRMLVLYDLHASLPDIDFNDHLSSFIVTGGN
ncbi:MAG: beta/gamma crystallin family protein [Proteobacteria bacterium]|nr:beta/gamma crystallin family protein [Pseudomonadota bacterium]